MNENLRTKIRKIVQAAQVLQRRLISRYPNKKLTRAEYQKAYLFDDDFTNLFAESKLFIESDELEARWQGNPLDQPFKKHPSNKWEKVLQRIGKSLWLDTVYAIILRFRSYQREKTLRRERDMQALPDPSSERAAYADLGDYNDNEPTDDEKQQLVRLQAEAWAYICTLQDMAYDKLEALIKTNISDILPKPLNPYTGKTDAGFSPLVKFADFASWQIVRRFLHHTGQQQHLYVLTTNRVSVTKYPLV